MVLEIDPSKGDFGIRLSVLKHSHRPGDTFLAMSHFVNAIEHMDRQFSRSIDRSLRPELLLESIEEGSLVAWFVTVLKAIPDEAIKELNWKKVIGTFLVAAKYRLLAWLGERESITDIAELEAVRNSIEELKQESLQEQWLLESLPLTKAELVQLILHITRTLSALPPNQRIQFISQHGETEINREFRLTDDQAAELLAATQHVQSLRMALKVRKPDYLGTSTWEFIHNSRAIKARIADLNWIDEFQHRKAQLLPGDALLVDVKINVLQDAEGNEFESKYVIERVVEVVTSDAAEQMEFFESGD